MRGCSHTQVLSGLLLLCLSETTTNALTAGQKLSQLGRQNWQTENGLPQNTVHKILQSWDGFLWLGTDGGLVRFDGQRFATYTTQNTPGLKSNNIQDLVEDNSGNLWLSTPDGVARWKKGVVRAFTTEDGLPAGRSWTLLCDSSGTVWAASGTGLASFSGQRFVPGPTFDNGIQALGMDSSRSIWVCANGSLSRLTANSGGGIRIGSHTGRVRSFILVGGEVWLGTDHGVRVVGPANKFAEYTTKEGLPNDRVTCLKRDRNGAVWVGTENGVARIQMGKVDTFPPNDSLSSDAIDSLFEDREGNVWIGGDTTGLTILRRLKFVTYSFREGGIDPQIRCILGTHDGTVWIGTDGGGLKHFKDGRFSEFTTAGGLSSNVVLALGEQANGALLVGTPDGLNRVQKSAVSPVESARNLPEDFVRSLYTDRDGSLWVGTRRGLSHISGEQVRIYTQADGLGSDTVGALLRDRHENLWIGTLHGLSRLDNTGIRNFTVAQGLSGNIITDLYEDEEGRLWIATQDGGLNSYSNGSFTSPPLSFGLPPAIYGVTEDRHRNIWLAAKSGIFRVNKDGLLRHSAQVPDSWRAIAYGPSDGLRVSECSGGGHPAVWKTADGDIWFATARGAALLAADVNVLNRVPPAVAIETVSIDDTALSPYEVNEISPGHTRISFEYAGLSFTAPQKVEFKYKLDGFDQNWIEAGTRRVAYYTNLPPRSYRFRVIARNNDGFWNETGTSISIRVLPHFYQTWWFYVLLLCLAGLTSYALYLWRLRQIKSRFDAVLAERNRIAREIHDTLAQGFVGVSVQLELVSRFLHSSGEAAREHLDQARILVRSSLAEARQSIWELRSQQDGAQDFAARLTRLAQQVSETGPVRVQLEIHGEYRPLRRDVEDELFRICQEAIANAVRHSGARQVGLDLTFGPRKLRMTVSDNGIGFAGDVNSQGPEGHFGLKGMRERAERIHAALNIESKLGSGTTVTVEAPAR